MGINHSTDTVYDSYIGDTKIGVAYLGSTLIFRGLPPEPINYFWSEAIESGTFTLTIASSVTTAMLTSVSYSTDNGENWTTTNNQDSTVVTITTPTISAGGKVLWKGSGISYASATSANNYSTFTGSANHNVGGDIGTLFLGDSYTGTFEVFGRASALTQFFRGDSKLINSEDLILSPLRGTESCYQMTFYNCSNLVTAPTIRMVNGSASSVMYGMFEGCSKLIVAPELNLTSVGTSSVRRMFMNCSSLTTPPPELKFTSVGASSCYQMFAGCSKMTAVPNMNITSATGTQWMRQMFDGCKLITTAPVLSITTLAQNCYYRMFYNCNALNYIKMMATDISASNCLYQWVSGVAASGTFVKNSSAQWTTTGVSGIPENWTVTTASS